MFSHRSSLRDITVVVPSASVVLALAICTIVGRPHLWALARFWGSDKAQAEFLGWLPFSYIYLPGLWLGFVVCLRHRTGWLQGPWCVTLYGAIAGYAIGLVAYLGMYAFERHGWEHFVSLLRLLYRSPIDGGLLILFTPIAVGSWYFGALVGLNVYLLNMLLLYRTQEQTRL